MLKNIEIIGLMSGTSLDGLDIAHVAFDFSAKLPTFELLHSETLPYSDEILAKLNVAKTFSVPEMLILDKEIGRFYALKVVDFIKKYKIDSKIIAAIASHGQTIFHQPENGFTQQIGCGTTLAFLTGIPVINDFRSLDVIAGGQGAPLVPIGDFLLFSQQADAFLNIGGFVNISFKKGDEITAFDICPGNLPLNKFAETLGLKYDKNGEIAKNGQLDDSLLKKLNNINFYSLAAPKSLGTEWLEKQFFPLIPKELSPEKKLRTITEHIAIQISEVLNDQQLNSVFLTGGGAHNNFLIECLKQYFSGNVIIPKEVVIDFKEAIVFAFLGARYLRNEETTISSVTGAELSLCTGVYHRI
jgi:anhydro-N-acetylmuramic acid kinase